MDVTLLDTKAVRIKSRAATIVVDPGAKTPKTDADGVVTLTDPESVTLAKIEGSRIVISGPGEYEVGGIKIAGTSSDSGCWYSMGVDGVSVLLATTGSLSKIQDKAKQCQILLLQNNGNFQSAGVTAQEPNVVIFYGEKAAEAAKSLGKDAEKAKKFTTTPDKLPAEMQVVVLE